MFNVMIVEDLEIIRKQIKRLSIWGEDTGFEIAWEAGDGQEALEKLQLQHVDLLITDIKMPRIDGIELLKEVQERDLASCVVFLSEHSEFDFAKEAIKYGIFDYLVKPIDPEELKRLLRKAKRYIEDKRQLDIQQQIIEDKILDKIELYCPITQIEEIANYISEGDKRAIKSMADLVDNIAIALENDLKNIAMVIQKAYGQIYTLIKEKNTWLDQYMDTNSFSDVSLLKYDDIKIIKDKMIKVAENLIFSINRFILKGKKSPVIEEVCNYVITNVENDINLSKISETLYLTKNYIGDIFKQETGMTLGEYITLVKLERAKKLLIENKLKIYEIAQSLGYENTEYFGKLFKKNIGLSPMEYRTANLR